MEEEEKYDDLQVDAIRGFENGFVIEWSSAGKGFGDITFIYGIEQLHIDAECMSKEFCIALMTKLIEKYYV